MKIKGTSIVWSFHAARHCLGTVLANPSRPRSRQSCTCGVRSLDQGSAQIFHKEPDGNIRVCSTKATTDTRKHVDLARLADPAWTAGVGSLGESKGRGPLEKREGLPRLDIVAPNPQDCGPQAGELSPLKVPRGSKEKAKGAGSRVHGDHPGALGCPGTANRAASTPRGRESSSHNDGLKRAITHRTARNTGNRSTASMQHHRVVR